MLRAGFNGRLATFGNGSVHIRAINRYHAHLLGQVRLAFLHFIQQTHRGLGVFLADDAQLDEQLQCFVGVSHKSNGFGFLRRDVMFAGGEFHD